MKINHKPPVGYALVMLLKKHSKKCFTINELKIDLLRGEYNYNSIKTALRRLLEAKEICKLVIETNCVYYASNKEALDNLVKTWGKYLCE